MAVRLLNLLFSLLFSITGGVLMRQLSGAYITLLSLMGQMQLTKTWAIFYEVGFTALGALVGFVLAGPIFRQVVELGAHIRRVPTADKVAAGAGIVIGVTLTALLGMMLAPVAKIHTALFLLFLLLLAVVSAYLGGSTALSLKDELGFLLPKLQTAEQRSQVVGRVKLVDTNVIIDGRIADIFRTGFVEGPVYVPDFVLQELHDLADSQDTLKRNRSRRGMDILKQMQEQLPGLVQIYDQYEPPFKPGDGVDSKLVKLAKELDAVVVTNDFNLNKVASLQNVTVLNVNELANAMKPVVLPGEELTVTILREGKEPGQGVAYLDDGTMVVVEDGKREIGKTVIISVNTVFQTAAGKMIFGNMKGEAPPREEVGADKDSGPHSGGRPRRKTATEAA